MAKLKIALVKNNDEQRIVNIDGETVYDLANCFIAMAKETNMNISISNQYVPNNLEDFIKQGDSAIKNSSKAVDWAENIDIENENLKWKLKPNSIKAPIINSSKINI